MSFLEIEYPWQYNFPPFFTLQPHTATRLKQLTAWKGIILEFCKVNKLCVLDVRESSDLPVFHNTKINRILARDSILTILNELQLSGNATPLDKLKNRWEIYWHTLDEWGAIIYNYVRDNNMLNTVLTLYELQEGETNENNKFYKLKTEITIKILKLLEEQGKCELILLDDQQGVKFF